jgi:hypothetical protein
MKTSAPWIFSALLAALASCVQPAPHHPESTRYGGFEIAGGGVSGEMTGSVTTNSFGGGNAEGNSSGEAQITGSVTTTMNGKTVAGRIGNLKPESDEAQSTRQQPKNYTETIRGTDITFEMIWVPAAHLWVGKTEVTWDEFLLYCDFEENNGIKPHADAVSKPSKPLDWTPYDRHWGAGKRPAVGMSWNSAKKYCEWLSWNTMIQYRLPSEKEWEKFAGAPPYDEAEALNAAWCNENSDFKTQEVASKPANEYGLHDIYGNLWEYCSHPFSSADPEQAVLRGGAWRNKAIELSPPARLPFDFDWTLRDPNYPPGVWWIPDGDHLGFRIVRNGPDKGSKK